MCAMALVAAVLQGVLGQTELVLYLTPLFLITTLLLSGHYVAEERIIRAWLAARPRVARPRRARWTLHGEAFVASLLERSPLCRRGPPALRALASS